MDIVRAVFTGHVSETLMLTEGELWDADHPLVKKHPEWFSADLVVPPSRRAPQHQVEEMTAEPGEKRIRRSA